MARAVITGIGAVTPVGLSAHETWASLLAGRSGVRPLTRFDASGFPVRIAADVQGFDPLTAMPRKRARRTARFAQLAIAAAKEALADARLPPLGEITDRFGVTIATALGGLEVIDEAVRPPQPAVRDSRLALRESTQTPAAPYLLSATT